MYLDGEMPVETFKERMELIAARYGRDLEFHGYNREDLGDGGMPPLNTPTGQAWLRREIDAIKPDIIVFDSIMCLLIGSLKEEETWAPMKALVCELSARRIAQVWLNHANDIGKSYGDKTRLWEMDTVAKLSPVEGDDGAIRFEFEKARLRTPANADQFEPVIRRERKRPVDGLDYPHRVHDSLRSPGERRDEDSRIRRRPCLQSRNRRHYGRAKNARIPPAGRKRMHHASRQANDGHSKGATVEVRQNSRERQPDMENMKMMIELEDGNYVNSRLVRNIFTVKHKDETRTKLSLEGDGEYTTASYAMGSAEEIARK
jgi:hypothetical protein